MRRSAGGEYEHDLPAVAAFGGPWIHRRGVGASRPNAPAASTASPMTAGRDSIASRPACFPTWTRSRARSPASAPNSTTLTPRNSGGGEHDEDEHLPSPTARHAVRLDANSQASTKSRNFPDSKTRPTSGNRFSTKPRSFATGVLDPLNRVADKEGCTWNDGKVTTPKGFKEAYKKFADAGWIGLPVPAEYGGQGLPQLLLGPTLEMWNACEHRLCQRSAAQSGRDRSDRTCRFGRAEAEVDSEFGFGQVDRHDESDRAASGIGSRASAHQSRSGRRSLSAHR